MLRSPDSSGAATGALDTLLLVPMEDFSGVLINPEARQVVIGTMGGPLMESLGEFEREVGFPLQLAGDMVERPHFGGAPMEWPAHRSLGAVNLSTHLDRAGLRWMTIDPGAKSLAFWRKELARLPVEPLTVGISTTFLRTISWIAGLISAVRERFPRAKIIVGGYLYAEDSKGFLSLDADVFCVGEGEVRYPQIVRALRQGEPLDGIRGLYLPNPTGGLRYTGRAEPLDLARLPAVDWTLSDRIEPPVDILHDPLELGLETQRGCVFKCGFCTFRTLASPNVMSTEVAVDRLFELARVRYGVINIIDATASYPHDRWVDFLERVVARGGSPHPITCFARVTDLPEPTVELMARAGVRQVFIGQESGDQRILNIMKKGTNLRSVRPALAALARNNINALVSFIHGYPGETDESLAATRTMIATINDDFPHRPAALLYTISPFTLCDLSRAANELGEHASVVGLTADERVSERWTRECLRTVIAASRVPHGPVNTFFLVKDRQVQANGAVFGAHIHRYQMWRWMKLVERGTAIYLERALDGTRPDPGELSSLKRQLDTFYDQRALARQQRLGVVGLMQKGKLAALRRLTKEFVEEGQSGPGRLTRLAVGALALHSTGKLESAREAFRLGTYATQRPAHLRGEAVDQELAEMAKITLDEGLENGKARMKIVDAEGRVLPTRKLPVITNADAGA